MSLRGKFLLYLALIHLVFIAAAAAFLHAHRFWLPAVEAFFVLSFLAGWRLVKRLAEPVNLLRTSVALLESEDFMTRFREANQPEVDRLIRLYNRMVDHLRDERVANQEQDSLLRRLFEISPSGMVALDFDGRVQSVNPGACEILGASEESLRGRPLDLARGLVDGEARLVTLRGRRKIRCRRLSFMDRGFGRSFIVLEELTRELHASQKAAYEKLIRTMSHEVNNTSGAVISLLESCLAYADQVSPADREDFRSGLDVAVSRMRHMNGFMRSFADVVRLPAPDLKSGSMEQVLRRVVRLTEPERRRRRIVLTWNAGPEATRVRMDGAQMEQALLNVFQNAFESIGSDGEVIVTLSGGELLIEDSGGGIPDDVAPKLFTSFYTSKPGGQGIGLTLVQEILIGHGFDFSLETTRPGWAGFRVVFSGQ